MDWYWYLLLALVAAGFTAGAAPIAFYLAKRFDAIDYPDGRRVNTKPVPRLGGVMLAVGVFAALGLFYLFSGVLFDEQLNLPVVRGGINYWGVILAALVMFGIGLVDDFVGLRPLPKFLGQIAAAIIATWSGVLLSELVNPFGGGFIQFGPLAYPITVFYLVAFANIINLIDGLDGLAAGISAISASALLWLALGKGGGDAVVFAVVIIGSCLAFLCFNFHPARIFMGDGGALLLGFLLGLVSLFGVVRTPALVTLLVPVAIAGIPVLDTAFAIVRRMRAHRSIGEADKGHMHHRFINLGFDQPTTVLIMYGLSALLSVCAVAIAQNSGAVRYLLTIALLVVAALLVWRLGLTESVLQHHYNKRPSTHFPTDHEDSSEL